MTRPESAAGAAAEPGPGHEGVRKAIHVLLTFIAAAILWGVPPLTAQALLVAAALVAVTVEAVRRSSPAAGHAFRDLFGFLMRPREVAAVTGATTLAVGLALTALLFPRHAALAGFCYVGVADAAGAVVGKRWGRHRYPNGKSAEGSLAFFVTALVVGIALPDIDFRTAGAAALVLTLLEGLTLPVDDNVFIPVAGAALIHLVSGGFVA